MHARRTPARHVFRYPVSYWLFDLDELPALEQRLRLLGQPTQPRLAPRLRPLRRRAAEALGHRPRSRPDDRPCPHAHPAARGRLRLQSRQLLLVLSGRRLARLHGGGAEQHLRRTPAAGAARVGASLRQRKRLTSRPSSGSTRSYESAFSQPADEVWARIHVRDDGGARPLTAVLHGRRRELSNRSLVPLLLRYPLQPLQVTALIHFEALRAGVSGCPSIAKPPFVPGEGSVRP